MEVEKNLRAEPMSAQTPDLAEARQKVLAAIIRLSYYGYSPVGMAFN